ncbi:hypothetical protein BVG16_20170 [Paenibacillus selenitireducens]|uniref:Glycosyltransferase 2-like domain-containing protein n=1 Tax=Paenibacillus selenitireducens TaxID=1324314 RepID=A0A1T2X701_9BACL|nr:glycosyltransferase family 2 protein [Paenibacillus selenitireducens]OPA75654.1 hypothetical protein BVG16_20170 [Paenibacillus selenitireducens]
MKKLLSLCMIVKNEEKVLERCLNSVSRLVDEIIIVDTGSKDRTKEIAFHFTDQVYDYQWDNDFSAARNIAISYATSQFILVLDADEYIDLTKYNQIINFLSSLPNKSPIAIIVPIYNFVGSPNSGNLNQIEAVRIFSNDPQVKFDRPIHEQVISTKEELEFVRFDLPIYHTGYTTESMEQKQKSKRNLNIFEHLKTNKQLNCYDNYTLGNEYFALSNYSLALQHYSLAYKNQEYGKTWMPQCLAQMLQCLFKLRQYSEMYELCEHAIELWPSACDFYWFKGSLFMEIGADEYAIQALHQCIHIAESSESSQTWIISPNYGSNLSYQLLSLIFLRQHDIENAVHALTKLLYINVNNQGVLLKLLPLLLDHESIDQIIMFLNQVYKQPEDYQLIMLFETSLLLASVELSHYYWKLCKHLNFQNRPDLPFYYAVITKNNELIMEYETNNTNTTGRLQQISKILKSILIEGNMDISINEDLKSSLLISLFRLGQYEMYDTLLKVTDYNHPIIINDLADYFFDNQHIDLGIDYYSTLLDNNQINLSGILNISRYYIKQGYLLDASDFIRNTIQLQPDHLTLYILYFLTSEHPTKRIVQQFYDLFPNYIQLPFVPPIHNN